MIAPVVGSDVRSREALEERPRTTVLDPEGSSWYRYGVGVHHETPAVDLTDDTSAARARDHIEQAFLSAAVDDGLRVAYDAHGPLVYRFCTRALGPHAAQDATQEVFITAWRRRDDFDPAVGSLAGWLIGIAKFRVLGALRSQARVAVPTATTPDLETAPVTSDAIDGLADRLLVADVLRTLPERAATAISLSYLDGLTQQQVAERTGVPLGTVKSDIRRGLERLERALGTHRG